MSKTWFSRFDTTATNSVWVFPLPPPESSGPLSRLQVKLWRSVVPGTDWLGNLVSDVRYYMWKLSK